MGRRKGYKVKKSSVASAQSTDVAVAEVSSKEEDQEKEVEEAQEEEDNVDLLDADKHRITMETMDSPCNGSNTGSSSICSTHLNLKKCKMEINSPSSSLGELRSNHLENNHGSEDDDEDYEEDVTAAQNYNKKKRKATALKSKSEALPIQKHESQTACTSWLTKDQINKLTTTSLDCYSSSFEPCTYSTSFLTNTTIINNTRSTLSSATATAKRHAKKVQEFTSLPPPPRMPLSSQLIYDMYGKLIPSCLPGICCLCNTNRVLTVGENKNSNNNDEDHELELLHKCPTCLREFHFTCCENRTYCRFCDSIDATIHLATYFEQCNEARANFESSYDYVLHTIEKEVQLKILLSTKASSQQQQETTSSTEPPSPAPPPPTTATATRGRNRNKQQQQQQQQQPTVVINNTNANNNNAVSEDSASNTVNIKLPESEFDYINQLSPCLLKKNNNEAFPRPEYLLGKCVHLYCPLDNIYHIGRIIDWRKAHLFMKSNSSGETTTSTNNPKEFYGNAGEMTSSEFLVRFKAGVNGRKGTIHEWILLEEHSLALGLDLVWGDKEKKIPTTAAVTTTAKAKSNKKHWMPGIIFIRTAREISTDIENITNATTTTTATTATTTVSFEQTTPCKTVACFFLGEDTWAFPRIKDEIADFFSPLFNSNRNQPTSRTIQLAVSLAHVEAIEQKQVLQWYQFVSSSCTSATAHGSTSILDYDTLSPLFVAAAGGDEQTNCIGILKSSYQQQYPRPSSQIKVGLDRFWLSYLASDEKTSKGSNNRTCGMDAIKHMSYQSLPSTLSPLYMKQLKKLQHEKLNHQKEKVMER